MLSNKEFAIENKVPATLSSDMEEFAMFTIDLGDVMTLKVRDTNGKRILKNENPHLVGKGVNLWDVTPIRVEMTKGEMIAATETERIASEVVNKAERLNRIAMYTARVENELPLFEDESDEWDTLSADEKFLALDVALVGGRCRRKGGVKNHEGFEALVDG